MLVDTGYFLSSDRTTHGEIRADAAAKNDLILKAYDQFRADVVNISAYDLAHVSTLLQSDRWASEALSITRRMVSANIVTDLPGFVAPAPFIVREIPAVKSKPIRAAFVGLAETNPPAPSGFRITDPVEVARRVITKAREQSDLVIVLAHNNMEEVLRIARVAGADVLIAGTGEIFTPPLRVGQTLVAFTAFETRFLGEIRFYRDGQGRFSTRTRYISLDEGLGDDPVAGKTASEVSDTGAKVFKENQTMLTEWLARTRSRTATTSSSPAAHPLFVSATACAGCHSAEYLQWTGSRHSRSNDSIVKKQAEFSSSCLACHAGGLKQSGSLAMGELPRLQSVQCEECHGPGSAHIAKPAKGYGRVANVRALCSSCHTLKTSPKFDFDAYWAKIKH